MNFLFSFLCCRQLTALKLLCSLLQRPEGSLAQVNGVILRRFRLCLCRSIFVAQVCCDLHLCSSIVDAAKEAEGDEL